MHVFGYLFLCVFKVFLFDPIIIMGRKAKFDTKQPKGPGRKARKQGEVDVKLFLSNIEKKNKNLNKKITPISKR